MIGSIFFTMIRLTQLITLIPIIGMLSWFVDGYTRNNQLTPDFILALFIVSVLAAVWALATLFRHESTKRSAHFVSFVDLLFVGGFIASVVMLRHIASVSCSSFDLSPIYVDLGIFGYYGREGGANPGIHVSKNCAMLKASFAFAIMNILFWLLSSFITLMMRSKESHHNHHTHHTHHKSSRTTSHHPARSSRSPRRSTNGHHSHHSHYGHRSPHYSPHRPINREIA